MKQMIAYLEQNKEKAWWFAAIQVLACSLFLALLGQLKIVLPFSPVPIVLQSKLVLLMAAFLGPRKGLMATLLFLAYGAFGLPVFSSGTFGYLSFFGPTGGYILAYPLAAYLVGFFVERANKISMIKMFCIYCLGMFGIIYPIGCLQLSLFLGLQKAFVLGAMPFALPDLLFFLGLSLTTTPFLKRVR